MIGERITQFDSGRIPVRETAPPKLRSNDSLVPLMYLNEIFAYNKNERNDPCRCNKINKRTLFDPHNRDVFLQRSLEFHQQGDDPASFVVIFGTVLFCQIQLFLAE